MIEHVSLRCTDPKRSRDFYERALAPLGYEQDWVYGDSYAFQLRGHHDFWVTKGEVATPLHLAFRCRTRKQVDAFYEAAIAAGARDHGKPGLRRDYGKDYYAAFVYDPDGHNLEAVSFAKPVRKATKGKRPSTSRRSRTRH